MDFLSIIKNNPAIFTWLILGFGSGLIAKYLLPGKDKGGLITTTGVGIVGAFVGGLIGKYFGIAGAQVGGTSIMSIVTAVVGAMVLLIALRVLRVLL